MLTEHLKGSAMPRLGRRNFLMGSAGVALLAGESVVDGFWFGLSKRSWQFS